VQAKADMQVFVTRDFAGCEWRPSPFYVPLEKDSDFRRVASSHGTSTSIGDTVLGLQVRMHGHNRFFQIIKIGVCFQSNAKANTCHY